VAGAATASRRHPVDREPKISPTVERATGLSKVSGGAWGLSEVFGWRHTLNERSNRATAKFYITYPLAHVIGAALEARALPGQWRMRGPHKYTARVLCLVVMGFGLYMVPQALGWT
jgi:hypothetical protein